MKAYYRFAGCLSFSLVITLYLIVPTELHAQQRIGGPYTADSATVLLLHLDGNLNNAADLAGDANAYGNVSFLEMQGAGDFNKSMRPDNNWSNSCIRMPTTPVSFRIKILTP